MRTRNLVTVLASSIAFCMVMTTGCATQSTTSSRGKEAPESIRIDLSRDVAAQGLAAASVGVYVKCIPPSTADTSCMPAADAVTIVTDPTQSIVFNLLTENRVFDERGVEFDQNYFNCSRTSDTTYTCFPNSPPVWRFIKYTIRVYGTTQSDPYAFVKN